MTMGKMTACLQLLMLSICKLTITAIMHKSFYGVMNIAGVEPSET